MNKLMLLLSISLLTVFACKEKEDHHMDGETEYHAHIHAPDATDKRVGDNLHIEVTFEDHAGGTVHHVEVKIFDKATNTVLYQKPDEAHVHETDGEYEFEDDFSLSGVTPNSTLVLEARVWGHNGTEGEVKERVEFRVLP